MPLNIAIIEDEVSLAEHLEYVLNEIDNSNTVLHKMGSVKEAVSWLTDHIQRCDLLFMDIRLSDGLSFEIFKTIKPSIPVVFITAYDDYALEAFKVNGIDYILKPFQKSDLEHALNKFKQTSGFFGAVEQMQSLMDFMERHAASSYREAYLVHYQNKLVPLSVDRIQWFHTEQEIVYAHTKENKKFIIDATLERVQEEVSPKQFFRANRQYIVQRGAVVDIDFYFNGRLLVNVLPKADEKILVSKAKAPEFKKWMDE